MGRREWSSWFFLTIVRSLSLVWFMVTYLSRESRAHGFDYCQKTVVGMCSQLLTLVEQLDIDIFFSVFEMCCYDL